MSRKPRSDSKLDALSEEQHVQLAEWLTLENISYAQARDRVREQFGVSTSLAALQSFYSRFAAPWKYARKKEAADQFAELMEGNFDAANIKAAKSLAFDALSQPLPDVKTAKTLLKIVGDSKKLELAQEKVSLDARKVALLEQKAALADKAKGIAGNEELSDAEKAAQMRSLFGMG